MARLVVKEIVDVLILKGGPGFELGKIGGGVGGRGVGFGFSDEAGIVGGVGEERAVPESDVGVGADVAGLGRV